MDPARDADRALQWSGVAVLVREELFEEACRAIDAIAGVEVRLRHPDGRRLIAVIESEGSRGQHDALACIRGVPGVLVAAPVFHHVDDPSGSALGADPTASDGEPADVL